MIQEKEAQDLMEKFISLRTTAEETKNESDIVALKKHEAICMKKFSYLVTMKTNRYKSFANYDDLNQEGFEALIMSMKNYNPKKGIFFWWAHKYIDTRISRSANLHTTIRYPLRVAREVTPHKESVMPLQIETVRCPDLEFENKEIGIMVEKGLSSLSQDQEKVMTMIYGLDQEKPISINKVCQRLGMTRLNCVKLVDSALSHLKDHVKL
jgi:RNA polymerase sigma factor (sigma-70 family)